MWLLLQGLAGILLGGLIRIAPSILGQVLIGLGVSVVTFTGVSATIGWLANQFTASALGLGPTIVGLLALMKVGTCVSMMTSAIVVRMTLNGLTNGAIKSWVKR